MHVQRRREEWARLSSLMALLANTNRDDKKRPTPYTPADFDPHTPPPTSRKFTMDEIFRRISFGGQGKAPVRVLRQRKG